MKHNPLLSVVSLLLLFATLFVMGFGLANGRSTADVPSAASVAPVSVTEHIGQAPTLVGRSADLPFIFD